MSIASTGLSHDERVGGLKPLAVSVRTASELTGLSVRMVWALIEDRRLDVTRIGGRTLVKVRSLEVLMASEGCPSPKPRKPVAAPDAAQAATTA